MTDRTWPYDDAFDSLRRYAEDDWLMMSRVVDLANGVTGPGSTKTEIADMTMRLVADLLEDGALPGEPVDDGFVAWKGSTDEHLARLREELDAMVVQDRLPQPTEVCWFEKVVP